MASVGSVCGMALPIKSVAMQTKKEANRQPASQPRAGVCVCTICACVIHVGTCVMRVCACVCACVVHVMVREGSGKAGEKLGDI